MTLAALQRVLAHSAGRTAPAAGPVGGSRGQGEARARQMPPAVHQIRASRFIAACRAPLASAGSQRCLPPPAAALNAASLSTQASVACRNCGDDGKCRYAVISCGVPANGGQFVSQHNRRQQPQHAAIQGRVSLHTCVFCHALLCRPIWADRRGLRNRFPGTMPTERQHSRQAVA